MLHLFNVQNGTLIKQDHEPAQIYVYTLPDESERRLLLDKLKVDEHTLASALDPDEVARLEFEPEHAAIIFKRPCNQTVTHGDDKRLEFKVASVGVFVFNNKLVVVQSQDMPLYGGLRPVARELTLREMLLRMLYRAISHFMEHLRAMNMIVDTIEQQISRSFENKHLLSLFGLEKSLVYYLNAIHSNDGLLRKMRNNAPKLGFTVEEVEMLDDIIIENDQCARQAQIYTDILTGMMDARASIVNNNLNVLMKTLNIITIAIMVPTMVVSIFSMNVQLPIPNEGSWPFWVVIGMSALALAVFMSIWRWKHW